MQTAVKIGWLKQRILHQFELVRAQREGEDVDEWEWRDDERRMNRLTGVEDE